MSNPWRLRFHRDQTASEGSEEWKKSDSCKGSDKRKRPFKSRHSCSHVSGSCAEHRHESYFTVPQLARDDRPSYSFHFLRVGVQDLLISAD